MKELDWYGLYNEGWQNEIVNEAFSHPAKFSRALIRRIYEHALERGWLEEGDAVLDCFAGVALGAVDALAFGLDWMGNELEPHFVDLGRGCECTGISKEDWVRCFKRWGRFRYKDGRHWCPRCVSEAQRVLEDWEPALPGMEERTASYRRNSGKIPHTEPHRYVGNLELFAKYSKNGARAVLLQGDSRDLLAVLGGARAQACVSSPPYAGIRMQEKSPTIGSDPRPGDVRQYRRKSPVREYSDNPANLGNMREGDYAAAIVSSPPYTSDGVGHDGGHPRLDAIEDERRASEGCARRPAYGQSAGQLGVMKEGDMDAVISSPPFIDAGTHQASNEADERELRLSKELRTGPGGRIGISQTTGYGQSPGQLAAMPEGAFEAQAVVSSPPWEDFTSSDQGFRPPHARSEHGRNESAPSSLQMACTEKYGLSVGQLGNAQGDTFWSAARQIVRQCWLALAPDGVAIWVLKAFVRNKAIVDFPDQWRRMCEACGFETLEWIRAWLVEDRGAQWALDGELVEKRVERKSFFRRLHEKKYPELSIDYEIVLVMRKAEAI